MKKNLLFLFSFALCSFSAFSQDEEEPLEYIEVSNDPGKAISTFYAGIEPIFFDANGTNLFAMGFGAYAHYHIKQNLMFQARFQSPYYRGILDGAYLEAGNKEPEGGYFSDRGPSKLMYVDLTASLKLLRIDRENRPMKIWLSTGGTDINNYIDGVYGTKRYQLMLRGGLHLRNTTVLLDQLPSAATTPSWPNSNPAFTNFSATSLYAGVSINKIWELVANITELDIGQKISRMHKAYYLDLMFAPMMNISPITNGSREVEIAGDNLDAGYLGKSRVGARFGVANMPEYKNSITGWEIGIFPSWTSKDKSGVSTGAFWKWWWIIDVYSSEK